MDYYSQLLVQPFLQTRYNAAVKSVDLSPLGDFWYGDAKNEDAPDASDLFRAVPWLYRGVQLRANAVSSMPFQITRGDTLIDDSNDYQNALGWLPNPQRWLNQIEAALTCYGAAYCWREKNRVTITALRYIRPDTVEPQIDAAKGLMGWKRKANGKNIAAPVEQIVYFWQTDPWVELGPPASSPIMAALAASNVLHNLDKFSAAYFARGAIKATLLTVSGAPISQERDRLKTWWKQLVSGVKNAWATEIVNADSVTPVVIGEGLKELSNAQLTSEKRQDIAQALGIPQSVMFSESAGGLGGSGVVAQDDKHFYDKTIVPECTLIEAALNEQVFTPLGLHWRFAPETLDVYQEDENSRAAAFAAYVGAGLPVYLVGEMLGLELPQGWTWEKLRQEKEEAAQRMQEQMAQAGPPAQDDEDDKDDEEQDAKALADLRAWRRKSAKRGRLAEFASDFIPAPVVDDVKAHSVNGWRDALDGVIAVYEGEEPKPVTSPVKAADTTELVAALRSATEALLHGQSQPID